jgi:hypothetical protein
MKNKRLIFFALSLLILSLTSCEIIVDIFRAGMGVGIFLVLLVIGVIAFIVIKLRKRD